MITPAPLIMSDSASPIYRKALEAYLAADLNKLLRILKSPELSRFESSLIEVRLLLKSNDTTRAGEILSKLEGSDTFLLGEKFFLTACLLSYKSEWQQATSMATRALLKYEAAKCPRGLFLSNYNLSVYYNRLGLDELSDEFIRSADSYVCTPSQAVLVLRAQSCSSLKKGEIELAVSQIEDALSRLGEVDAVDAAHTRAVASEVYARAQNLDKAEENLKSLIRCKTLPDKARVKFDLILISILRNPKLNSTGSTCATAISENAEYSLKWKVVKSLQEGDPNAALQNWSDLVHQMPLRYKEEFQCHNSSDKTSLFMLTVQRLRSEAREQIQKVDIELKGKQQLLFNALNESQTALRKEFLIEQVWGCDYDPALDSRFYKLVERLKQTAGIEIEVSRQTYRLKRNKIA